MTRSTEAEGSWWGRADGEADTKAGSPGAGATRNYLDGRLSLDTDEARAAYGRAYRENTPKSWWGDNGKVRKP